MNDSSKQPEPLDAKERLKILDLARSYGEAAADYDKQGDKPLAEEMARAALRELEKLNQAPPPPRPVESYGFHELVELRKTDPARYREISNARKQAAQGGRR